MSGRGRGIDNAPAWMASTTHNNDKPRDRSRSPPARHHHRGRNNDDYYGGGPPPRRHHDDHRYRERDRPAPPRHYDDRRSHGGGGGGGRRRSPPPPPPRRGSGGPRRRSRSPRAAGAAPGPPPPNNQDAIVFRSYDEERDWVDDRRRKRLQRPSKFDVPPTPEQAAADAAAAALANPGATDFAGVTSSSAAAAAAAAAAVLPQQTRHARRLYLGNIPPMVTEDMIHQAMQTAIDTALVSGPLPEDPILSVYINHERRFCFVEFKTVEMATACMNLDGLEIQGQPVKIKRPNDYNELLAPQIPHLALPELDVSRLGIISSQVPDGRNKIFIGGLPYHLQEPQVLELLQAFGKVKAFHLVKNDPDSDMSKGYCFVEYSDASLTEVAVQGLNGMDLGGGKTLTARLAGERSQADMLGGGVMTMDPGGAAAASYPSAVVVPPAPTTRSGAPPPDRNIVFGYDVELLVDAAMGQAMMPVAPQYVDSFNMPLTRVVSVAPPLINQNVMMTTTTTAPMSIAAAAATPVVPPIPAAVLNHINKANNSTHPTADPNATRVLVLLNMVTTDDLASDDAYQELREEVQEECAKFGKLQRLEIPRSVDHDKIAASAFLKIYLQYGSVTDAQAAQSELAGRQFGEGVVETLYYPEADFAAGILR